MGGSHNGREGLRRGRHAKINTRLSHAAMRYGTTAKGVSNTTTTTKSETAGCTRIEAQRWSSTVGLRYGCILLFLIWLWW